MQLVVWIAAAYFRVYPVTAGDSKLIKYRIITQVSHDVYSDMRTCIVQYCETFI